MTTYIFKTDDSISETTSYIVTTSTFYKKTNTYGLIDYTPVEKEPDDRFTGTCGWHYIKPSSKSKLVEVPTFNQNEHGISINHHLWPLRFCADVKEKGPYKVTLTLGYAPVQNTATASPARIEEENSHAYNINVYTGRKNLVARDLTIKQDQTLTLSFHVHIKDYVALVGKDLQTDMSVSIAVLGHNVAIQEVTIEKDSVPTLYIAGDSIVADYPAAIPYNPLTTFGAWGPNMLQYFDNLAIDNQAHGGLTTNCFRDDGHWDAVIHDLKAGDIFMYQFGHNDQKRRNLKAHLEYAANLRWYARKIREKGATPIIVTSLSRIPDKDGKGFYDLLSDHANACLKVGEELNIPVIDLHEHSFKTFIKMSKTEIADYFMDAAHTNEYGAVLMADFMGREIRSMGIEPLASHLKNNFKATWTPDKTLRPMAESLATEIPEKPVLSTDLPDLPYADVLDIEHLDILKTAMKLGLLDPCIKFFHPYDMMPRGQFLYVFFKAVKVSSMQKYQGRFCDIYTYEFDAQAVQNAYDYNLIPMETIRLDRYRPDEGITYEELYTFVIRSLHPLEVRSQLDMSTCCQEAKEKGLYLDNKSLKNYASREDVLVTLVRLMTLKKI